MKDILDYQLGSISVGDILLAVVVFVVGFLLARLILKALDAIFARSRMDRTLLSFSRGLMRVVAYFVLAVVVAGSLGISATSLVAVFSVAGLAMSLAAQTSLSNLAGGVTLLALRPFKVGDFVQLGGESGTVRSLGLIYTELLTLDNKAVFLPNSSVSGGDIVNYSREGLRMVDKKYTASYDDAVDDVKAALAEALASVPGGLAEPAPLIAVSSFGASSVEYLVRLWCATGDYWDVSFALNEAVPRAFKNHGVSMTYDHLNVHVV